jgi:Zc3h12a-like Ribonuclease NYN domain/S1 RNA binding domain
MKIKHVIIDGSNIATEGRDTPSLAQLDEAVQAFVEEYSPTHVTVVVDATFPNRIDRKERQTYEDAVNANELITPPAGAIGRGDAFVLQIARRAGAAILSNDSFQEFHGEYPWLFERGRLFGGKPVPHVGWVFMERTPVRGPTSRRAVSEARKVAKATEKVPQVVADVAEEAAGAAAPDGVEPAEKPGRRRRAKAAPEKAPVAAVEVVAAVAAEPDGAGDRGRGPEPYNEALPFIDFVGRHPVGSEVEATIERFSSHGAYVLVGEARAYVPLRNLAHPAPRSAKGILRVGETRRFVVVAIDPPRRGIDLGVPGVVEIPAAPPPAPEEEAAPTEIDSTDAAAAEAAAPVRKSRSRKATAKAVEPEVAEPAAGEAPARKSRSRKATAKAVEPAPETEAPGRRSRSRKATAEAVEPAPSPEAPARRSRSRKATANAIEPAPAPETEAPGRRSRSRKATAKAAPAEQAAAAEAGGGPAEAPVRKSRARNATAKAAAKAPERVAEAPVRKSRARNATAKPGGGTGDGAVVEPAGEAAGA